MSSKSIFQKTAQVTPASLIPSSGILQRQAVNSALAEDTAPRVNTVLRSPGQPLDAETRTVMEEHFQQHYQPVADATSRAIAAKPATANSWAIGAPEHANEQHADQMGALVGADPSQRQSTPRHYDFSQVRVHTDPQAAASAHQLNAAAYTSGRDVVFGAGQYRPQTKTGRQLLAHELTHVLQQAKAPAQSAQTGLIQRKELNTSLWGRLWSSRAPQDWYMADRMSWQQASVGGTIAGLSGSNTFIRACIYNTQHLRPAEYQNVEQRHDYYDLISYVIEHDPNTPAAARGVRFFHATTLVTGSPGIGTVDSPLGAAVLQQDTRVILREVNADLFQANMAIIQNLLLNWREPRSPSNPSGAISAFEFDLQMVEYEQTRVEDYIRQNQARFTPDVVTDINDTLDPSGFGQSFNPSQQNFQWAMQALGVSRLDFTRREHRIAIGIAAVHLFHRKSRQEYLTYMRQRTPQPQPQP